MRTRAAALIDGCIKIDLGPDTLTQVHRDQLDARDWCGLVFTHGHDDHIAALGHLIRGGAPIGRIIGLPFTIELVRAKLAS